MDDLASLVGKRVRIESGGIMQGSRGVAVGIEDRCVLVKLDAFPEEPPALLNAWCVVLDKAYPPAVYAAAKQGFERTLAATDATDRDGDPRGVLARIQGRAGFHLQHPGRERETLAFVLGASAVPAVLRVRARREAEALRQQIEDQERWMEDGRNPGLAAYLADDPARGEHA